MTDEARGDVLIVAIDGPSGVGKSTVAKAVAIHLGIPYLSTGAMYRALALEVLRSGTDPEDRGAVESLVRDVDLTLVADGPILRVVVNGRDPGSQAYSLEVSQVTSMISAYGGVRERMVELQRSGSEKQGAVLEGRDIGTRVFPDTPHKFFLEATPVVRAERRWLQLPEAARNDVDRADVLREVEDRDERDSTRKESPLTRDSSYTLIDTDDRSAEDVAALIVARVLEERPL